MTSIIHINDLILSGSCKNKVLLPLLLHVGFSFKFRLRILLWQQLCPESTAGLRDHLWCAVQFVIRTKHGSRLADRTHVCFVVNRPWRVICIRTWHCCHYFILIWPSWFQTTWLVFVVLICLQSFISLKLTLIEGRIVCTLMSNAYVHYSTQEATTWRLPVGTQRCWNEI